VILEQQIMTSTCARIRHADSHRDVQFL